MKEVQFRKWKNDVVTAEEFNDMIPLESSLLDRLLRFLDNEEASVELQPIEDGDKALLIIKLIVQEE